MHNSRTICIFKFYQIHTQCTHSLSVSPAWLFAIPWTVAHQSPLSVEFSQARILEWVAIFCSRGSSWPKEWSRVFCISCIDRWILYHLESYQSHNKLEFSKFSNKFLIFKTKNFHIFYHLHFSSIIDVSLFVVPWNQYLELFLIRYIDIHNGVLLSH